MGSLPSIVYCISSHSTTSFGCGSTTHWRAWMRQRQLFELSFWRKKGGRYKVDGGRRGRRPLRLLFVASYKLPRGDTTAMKTKCVRETIFNRRKREGKTLWAGGEGSSQGSLPPNFSYISSSVFLFSLFSHVFST